MSPSYDDQIARDTDNYLRREEHYTMTWERRSRELEEKMRSDPALCHEIFVTYFLEREDTPQWLTELANRPRHDPLAVGMALAADWQAFLKRSWSKLVEAYTTEGP